jgi:site-specific DNA recombinase
VRALIYVRQSLAADELAVDRQRLACEQVCKDRSWTVVDVVAENDTSATRGPRPKYAEVLRRMERREFDILMVWHVDRLVRRLDDLEHLITVSERAGVKVATASGDLDLSTDAGRLVGRILASVARAEVERKGTRQRAADLQRARSGLPHPGGSRAFGYERDGMTIRPAEADVIRKGYEMLVGGGSFRGVAKMWTDSGQLSGKKRWSKHGMRPVTGWSPDTVADMLRNPRYAGIRVYKHPDGRVEEFPAAWPPIVPEETYRAALSILNDPDRKKGPRIGQTLLTGLALCGVCNVPVHSGGGHTVRGGQASRGYRCAATSGHVGRRAEPVEDLVEKAVIARLSAPDAQELLIDRERPDVPALLAERQSIRERKLQLARDFAADFDPAQMRAANEVLAKKLTRVEEAIADAGRLSALRPLVEAEDKLTYWRESMDLDSKRAAVEELMTVRLLPVGRGRRTFNPESVEVTWKV